MNGEGLREAVCRGSGMDMRSFQVPKATAVVRSYGGNDTESVETR